MGQFDLLMLNHKSTAMCAWFPTDMILPMLCRVGV